MKVGIVGLGLIGGSLAKDYTEAGGYEVYAIDKDRSITELARMTGVINGALTDENIGDCELILIAIYPEAAIAYLKENAARISTKATVIDCCGTKEKICEAGFRLADEYGFDFVGGHPMAGRHYSGFKYSKAGLFKNAPMVIVPRNNENIEELAYIKRLLAPLGLGQITLSTAQKHDEMIAFTSQMAHVVSNAYIKSPTARSRKGFSAGSYKDMTRVAWLNADMWTELFMENKENLLKEMDCFINALIQYREAIESDNAEALHELLEEGKRLKEEVDGNR